MSLELMGKDAVPAGKIGVQWLGQAGFLIQDEKGLLIAVDPYLSDSVEKKLGPDFKRIMPAPAAAEELLPDLLLITHHHEDHYDVETVPVIMKQGGTFLIGCPVSVRTAREDGSEAARTAALLPKERITAKGVGITAVYADHGELAPEAIGFLVEISGLTIYIVGDSAYRPKEMKACLPETIDVMIVPINGEYGNCSPEEAALLARDLQAKYVIPCHFWMFPRHRGDPQRFIDAMAELGLADAVRMPAQGEIIFFTVPENVEKTS
jgi:L-ascorbate 6-phosphate lactonase